MESDSTPPVASDVGVDQPTAWRALIRGTTCRCPRCGRTPLFSRWMSLKDSCTECGLSFEAAEGNTWAFMYISTAGLTGLVLAYLIFVQVPQTLAGQCVLFLVCVVLILATLQYRKGMGVALDYLSERYWPSAPIERVPEAVDRD